MDGYYDLGKYSRPVTTESTDAQVWFDRGLNWTYGYNQDEAIRCFTNAIELDPACAMAHWGLAYAYGPYLNKEWRFYSAAELKNQLPLMHETAAHATRLAEAATQVEHALCIALTERYPAREAQDLEELTTWDSNFADAMAEVYEQFPQDGDVVAIYSESMMMRTPWRLWELDTGSPTPGADTLRIVEILQADLLARQGSNGGEHPGVAHMMCHAMEMSQTPEEALPAAGVLRDLAPSNAHLLHMPGHIDVLCGRYTEAIETSARAIAADKVYLDKVGPYGQYTAAICHDNHLMMHASMLLGRWDSAIAAADMICEIVTDEVLARATPAFQITLESYVSMRIHVFVRFGKWAEILEQPQPTDPSMFPVSSAMGLYARAIAHAALGDESAADRSAQDFEAAVAKISADRHLFNNTAHTVLAVAREMMRGEIAYHRGEHDGGFEHLRQAVRLDDSLNYTEPWAWMHPPRHALGALLLAEGHVDEAMRVYRVDLGLEQGAPRANVHPENVWAMHGYVECLTKAGQTNDLAHWKSKLENALQQTDTKITSSCGCRRDS